MKPLRSKVEGRSVRVTQGSLTLEGDLTVPRGAAAVVLFAHGSGSSRHSSRNRFVAGSLQESCLGTLLFDLLSPEEGMIDEHTAHLRFDIPLLAERLMGITRWLSNAPETKRLKIGYFGASTGGGAALVAASKLQDAVYAVVSRGGRPDLAGPALHGVRTPTLLIVGENDPQVLQLNRQALEQLGASEKRLEIVPDATHLFEEPGALEEVARLSGEWFTRHAWLRSVGEPERRLG